MMDDKTRLELLYTSVPCDDEQKAKKERLINELERKLGIIKPNEDAMVVNGDLDDCDMFKGVKR
jgi:hypothetical protein